MLTSILMDITLWGYYVYNPYSGSIKSNIFLFTTGSGFTAILGAVLYYLASVTLFKKYMVSDRDDLEIV